LQGRAQKKTIFSARQDLASDTDAIEIPAHNRVVATQAFNAGAQHQTWPYRDAKDQPPLQVGDNTHPFSHGKLQARRACTGPY